MAFKACLYGFAFGCWPCQQLGKVWGYEGIERPGELSLDAVVVEPDLGEEPLVEHSALAWCEAQVGIVTVREDVQGLVESARDVLNLGLGRFEGQFGGCQFAGDAFLLGLEQIEG